MAFQDAEGAIKTWLSAVLDESVRVFFGFSATQPLPQVTVERSGGSPMQVLAPVDEPLIRFVVRAKSKAQAAQLAYQVADAVEGIHSRGTMGGVTVLSGYIIEGPRWAPDDEQTQGKAARYILTGRFQILGSQPEPATT